MRFLIGWLLPALLVVSVGPVAARPYQVEDLLRQQGYGRTLIDPTHHWLVIEKTVPWEAAARFDLETEMGIVRGRLLVVDLTHPAPARPLLAVARDAGVIAYGFSPDGQRLAVGRLDRQGWQLGVVTLATGQVRWFDLTPGYDLQGYTFAWIDGTHLLAIAHDPDDLPIYLRPAGSVTADLPPLWAKSAMGTGRAVTVVGSGRLAGLTPALRPSRLVDLDVDSGAVHVLATGALRSFSLSPDHRHIALLVRAGSIPLPPDRLIAVGTATERTLLSIIDRKTGAIWTPCPDDDVVTGPPVWSPSGARLLAYVRRDGEDWPDGRIVSLAVDRRILTSVDRGVVRPAIGGLPDAPASVALGWLGATPLVYGTAEGGEGHRADWFALRPSGAEVLTRAMPQVPSRLLTVSGSRIELLSSDGLWSIGVGSRRLAHRSAPAGASLVALGLPGFGAPQDAAGGLAAPVLLAETPRPGRGTVVSFLDRPGASVTLAGEGMHQVTAALAGSSLLVWTDTHPNGVVDLRLGDDRRPSILLDSLNLSLADVDPARTMPIRTRDGDGNPLTSWLLLPPPGGPDRKPPLVVIAYPGRIYGDTPPASQMPGQDQFHTNAALLAAHGYAVLLASMPAHRLPGHPADHLLADIFAPLDAVLAQGLADPARLGLWGQSYGGWAAAMVATQTERFKAIVASAGLYDLGAMTGTFVSIGRTRPQDLMSPSLFAGWAETGQPDLGATLSANAAVYTDNSPAYHADRVHTPLLLTAADMDISPLSGAEQMFSALYRLDKDAELATYWGEGHVIISPDNVRDFYARVFAWFDSHVAQDCGVVLTTPRPAGGPSLGAPPCGPATPGTSSRSSPP